MHWTSGGIRPHLREFSPNSGFGVDFNKFYSGRKARVRRATRLTFRAGDTGASPRMAGYLVNGAGFGFELNDFYGQNKI